VSRRLSSVTQHWKEETIQRRIIPHTTLVIVAVAASLTARAAFPTMTVQHSRDSHRHQPSWIRRIRANYRPTAKFSVSASETWDRFRLPLPNGNFSVVLASLQGNYSFNRLLSFTSLVQMDTSNTQAVSANLRIRCN